MITRVSRVLVAAALAAGLTATATFADTAPATIHYDTTLSQLYGATAPDSATMDLRTGANGIITGYYHPENITSFVLVTGGRTGDKIWLDIGRNGRIHVTGSIVDGVITGQAVDSSQTAMPFAFTATPSKAPGT